MKLHIAVTDLLDSLKVVNLIPDGEDLAGHFLFRPVDGGLEILTYGGRCFSSVLIKDKLRIEGEGSFTLPRKRLTQLLTDAGSGDVMIWEQDKGNIKVSLSIAKKPLSFQGKTPDEWPYWDESLARARTSETTIKTRVSPTAFITALKRAKPFVLKDERTPQFGVVEVRQGNVLACDQTVLVVSKIDDLLDTLNVRIYQADLAPLLSWLGEIGTEHTVEVISTDAWMVMVRPDGAVFGESRAATAFPNVPLAEEEPAYSFTFAKEEAIRILRMLRSAAPAGKDDRYVELQYDQSVLSLAMDSAAKGANDLTLMTSDVVVKDPTVKLPRIKLSDTKFEQILRDQSEERVTMGVFIKPRTGGIRFKDTQGTVTTTTTQVCVYA